MGYFIQFDAMYFDECQVSFASEGLFKGFADRDHIDTVPEIDFIRNTPEFKKIVKKYIK